MQTLVTTDPSFPKAWAASGPSSQALAEAGAGAGDTGAVASPTGAAVSREGAPEPDTRKNSPRLWSYSAGTCSWPTARACFTTSSRTLRIKVQLNLDNPLDWQSPRLVSVGTDTDGIYGTPYAIVPLRWEMRIPRTARLTTTFNF